MQQAPISCPHCGSTSIITREWVDRGEWRTDFIGCFDCRFGDFFEERPSQIGRPPLDDQRSEALGVSQNEPGEWYRRQKEKRE